MIWILITLIATVSWGFTDLFSKMSVDYNDKDFYIKLTIWTGRQRECCLGCIGYF